MAPPLVQGAMSRGIEHRLTKPNHPWTNGQVERMNLTIKEATVKRFHYESHGELRAHLGDFLAAYNFARRLKTLSGLTPYEYICKIWTSEPDRFIVNPIHQMPGLNTWTLGRSRESFETLKAELEDFMGAKIEDAALHASIKLFNRNRQMIRERYQMRKAGTVRLSATEMQHIVKSSMIMDKADHNALLDSRLAWVKAHPEPKDTGIRLYLSGHFRQTPKREVLDMIGACGTVIGRCGVIVGVWIDPVMAQLTMTLLDLRILSLPFRPRRIVASQ